MYGAFISVTSARERETRKSARRDAYRRRFRDSPAASVSRFPALFYPRLRGPQPFPLPPVRDSYRVKDRHYAPTTTLTTRMPLRRGVSAIPRYIKAALGSFNRDEIPSGAFIYRRFYLCITRASPSSRKAISFYQTAGTLRELSLSLSLPLLTSTESLRGGRTFFHEDVPIKHNVDTISSTGIFVCRVPLWTGTKLREPSCRQQTRRYRAFRLDSSGS